MRIPMLLLIALVSAVVAGCSTAAARTVELQLQPLNGSGVTGNVTMTAVGENRTLIQIQVDPAGNPSMPAHIHPGSCDDLVPQPKYPLENVVDGVSVTEVPASLDELLSGGQALNIHHSNEDMRTYTACVDLR
jgi:hypothetical protein